jgi:hypothetical protein
MSLNITGRDLEVNAIKVEAFRLDPHWAKVNLQFTEKDGRLHHIYPPTFHVVWTSFNDVDERSRLVVALQYNLKMLRNYAETAVGEGTRTLRGYVFLSKIFEREPELPGTISIAELVTDLGKCLQGNRYVKVAAVVVPYPCEAYVISEPKLAVPLDGSE